MKWIVYLSTLFFLGCTSLNSTSPFLSDSHFQPIRIDAEIPLKGMIHQTLSRETLYVFIEGDGHAWIRHNTPSLDPTPKTPTGWHIASRSFKNDCLYLTRPCQYLEDKERSVCTQDDWTNGRYSQKLVDLLNRSIEHVKVKNGYQKIVIGGYSGGGTMAMLIALKRSDVKEIITVASPIDIDQWTKFHQVTSLEGSLNPADTIDKLSQIKQRHYIGKKDNTVPLGLVQKTVMSYPPNSPVEVVAVEGLDHKMEGFRIPFSD